MPDILFLTQRIPYPPIKGEKIRPLQILRHVGKRYAVHLGTLIDDPSDWQHVDTVRRLCADAYFAPLDRRIGKIACLRGLLTGAPLSFAFFRDRGLFRWVRRVLDGVRPEVIFVCSTNMAQYVLDHPYRPPRLIVDYADVDSAKWADYATQARGPRRFVFAREARLVRAAEQRIAQVADACTFVSEPEAELFRRIAPAHAAKIAAIGSGVDAKYFAPDHGFPPPYDPAHASFVFTGTMDYWPNVDAVTWFAKEILPAIRRAHPLARFFIVGSAPAPAVQRLRDQPGVQVTGRVPDVRPYLEHAVAAVAPMRVARGIQNKVLEAMAMAKPVIVTTAALTGIDVDPDREILLADTVGGLATACCRLIDEPATGARVGAAARRRILAEFRWPARLAGFDPILHAPHQTPTDATAPGVSVELQRQSRARGEPSERPGSGHPDP